MADERLKQFALKLRDEVQALAARLSQVEKIRAVARDGRDGAPGTPGESGAKGDRGEAGERGAQGLPGRDGRDGLPGPKGDSVTRAEVEPGNMLAIWIGDVKTLAGRIVAQRGEKGDKGDPGLPGPKGDKGDPGKDGKDGTKITKVELNGRELFIWLDGVKKKVGQIAFPSLGAGGGGVQRALAVRDLPRLTCANRTLTVGTTGGLLTTLFQVFNETNFPGLTMTLSSEDEAISLDPALGEITFNADGVVENLLTFNSVAGSGGAVMQYLPEVYREGAWMSELARGQTVPQNSNQQDVLLGSLRVKAGQKARINVRAVSGTVDLASQDITDGVLSGTIPALVWYAVFNRK